MVTNDFNAEMVADISDAREAAASAEVCLRGTINHRHSKSFDISTYEASSAVSVMGVPLGAETPIELSLVGSDQRRVVRAVLSASGSVDADRAP